MLHLLNSQMHIIQDNRPTGYIQNGRCSDLRATARSLTSTMPAFESHYSMYRNKVNYIVAQSKPHMRIQHYELYRQTSTSQFNSIKNLNLTLIQPT